MRSIFTFDTTHHALWAEEVALASRIPHEVVSAPPAAKAKCSIALETLLADTDAFAEALTAATVPFRIHAGEPGPDASEGGE